MVHFRVFTTGSLGVAFLLLATPIAAFAQSTPCNPNSTPGFTSGGNVFGAIAPQWNAYFGAKADINGGTLCSPTITSPVFTGQVVLPGGTLGTMAYQSAGSVDITGASLITGLPTPVNPTDAATKQYVDSAMIGLTIHTPVNLATAAALPANTYNNGTAGIGATLTGNANGALSVDGVAVATGNRILVIDEANGANNGAYTVTQTGSSSLPYILTRATDFDSSTNITHQSYFFVTSGNTNAGSGWLLTTVPPITVGTTALTFTQFSSSSQYMAGSGLNLAGSTFSIPAQGVLPTMIQTGPVLQNTTALRAAATTGYPNGLSRFTDGIAEAPELGYIPGTSVCATDDGASCVDSSDSKSWNWQPSAVGVDVRQWGCVADGVTNVNTCLQNAINATPNNSVLHLGPGKYCITGLTISRSIKIEGLAYGGDNAAAPTELVACAANPAAMITIDEAAFGTVLEDFGIFPGTDATNAASGAAIVNYSEQSFVTRLLIRDACTAILEDGNGTAYTYLRINGTAMQPGCSLVQFGDSTHMSIDPRLEESSIDDGAKTVNTTTSGLDLQNVGGFYIHHNDILFMDDGTRIFPGAGETVSGGIMDDTVAGDTVNENCLDIETASSSAAIYELHLSQVWAGSCSQQNHSGSGGAVWGAGDGVVVRNTSNGLMNGIHFFGLRAVDVGSYNVLLEGGTVNDLTFDGGEACGGGNDTAAAPFGDIGISSTTNYVAIRDMTIGNRCEQTGGATIPDVYVSSGAGTLIMVGNHLVDDSTSGTPETGLIKDNYGLDDQQPPITSATTITLPTLGPVFSISGTTTITNIDAFWPGREIQIVDSDGAALATGGNIASVPSSFSDNQLITCLASASSWACH